MWRATLILISCIGFTVSRPQNQPEKAAEKIVSDNGSIEIERQLINEFKFPENDKQRFNNQYSIEKKVDESTREILEKIANVNKKQGLTQKKPKPTYFHFPFSYSRSQNEEEQRSSNNFKFSRDPFSNPIFDYLEKENKKTPETPSFRRPNIDNEQYPENYGIAMTDNNPEILPEDNIPGQYIKRKITHYQSFILPNPYMFPQAPVPEVPPIHPHPNLRIFPSVNPEQPKNKTVLEKQTIDNIRDIIFNNQGPMFYNYPQNSQFYPQITGKTPNKARQNWNWPGANFFPIYIRDPFLQMYYAVTNMIEYGPAAGNEGPCKLTPRPGGSRLKVNSKASPGQQVTVEADKKIRDDEMKLVTRDLPPDDISYLDVEDIDLGENDLVKLTINLPEASASSLEAREFKEKAEKMDWNEFIQKRNDTRLTHLASGKLDFNTHPPSPIIKDPILQIDQLEDETAVESEKAEDLNITNENVRRIFSRDNTGNGIFIHKLKVRKGGVAIAGPGGIATAGSGGTAIVGPNGVAYTHPNGLAIAGSGTQVVAVDPAIDLNEVIKDSVLNGTRHVPNTRVGKVVAVGPVVYYNRGEDV